MTVLHRRAEWVWPSQPVSGPALDRAQVSHLVAHWPGWGRHQDGSPTMKRIGSDGLMASYMRQTHASYLAKDPPYSIAYSWTIPPQGEVWEGRGYDIRDAASGSASWNAHTMSVKFANHADQPPTPEQIDTARWLHAHLSGVLGRRLEWLAHGQVRLQTFPTLAAEGRWATQCPGPHVWDALQAGAFYPLLPPPPPPEDDNPVYPTAIITCRGGRLHPDAYIVYAEFGHCRTWLPTHAAIGALCERSVKAGKPAPPGHAVDLSSDDGIARMRSMPLHGGARSLNGINVDDWGVPL